jgi:hypothetical protein
MFFFYKIAAVRTVLAEHKDIDYALHDGDPTLMSPEARKKMRLAVEAGAAAAQERRVILPPIYADPHPTHKWVRGFGMVRNEDLAEVYKKLTPEELSHRDFHSLSAPEIKRPSQLPVLAEAAKKLSPATVAPAQPRLATVHPIRPRMTTAPATSAAHALSIKPQPIKAAPHVALAAAPRVKPRVKPRIKPHVKARVTPTAQPESAPVTNIINKTKKYYEHGSTNYLPAIAASAAAGTALGAAATYFLTRPSRDSRGEFN